MRAALAPRIRWAEVVAATAALVSAALVGAVIAAPGALGVDRALVALVAGVAAVATLADTRAGLFVVVVSLATPTPVAVAGFDLHPAHVFIALFTLRAAGEVWVGNASLPRGLALPIVLVVFGALIASVAGPQLGGSLYRLVDVVAVPLAGALAIATLFDPERHMRTLVLAAAAALALAGLTAVMQGAGVTAGPLDPAEGGRVNGLFEHPNVLGGFIAPLLALFVGIAAREWRQAPFAMLTLAVPLLLGIAGLVLSLSRGALVGLALAIAATLILLIAQRQVVAVLAAVLLVVVAGAIALPRLPASDRAEFEQRLEQLFQPGTEIGRELIYRQALRVIGDYPLTGVGPLTFGKVTRERTPIPDIEPGREHAHNLFLEGLLSLGPLGLAGLLWLIVGATIRYVRRARAPAFPLEAGWAVGGVAALVAMVAQGGGDFIFSNLEPLALLGMFVGVAYALASRQVEASAA